MGDQGREGAASFRPSDPRLSAPKKELPIVRDKTRKRLERLEAAAASNDRLIKVEFCNLSPAGELIPLPNRWGIPDDDRPAQRTLQIILADSDGNSGPGRVLLPTKGGWRTKQ